MKLINFLKGVDIDKQRKRLLIDPFNKGDDTNIYNIGRNGSATLLKVEYFKTVFIDKNDKTYTANGITYDVPTLATKLGKSVDQFVFFVFDDTPIKNPENTFISFNNSQHISCKTNLIGPGFAYMPINCIDKVYINLSGKKINITISALGSYGFIGDFDIVLETKTTITKEIVKSIIWWFRDPICLNNGCSILSSGKFHFLTGFYPHGSGKYVMRFTCFNPTKDDTFIYWYVNTNTYETLMSANIESIKALL